MFGISGSVMRRNLVPVWVWKQVRRKKELSRLSRPVEGRWGFGTVVVWEEEEGWGFGLSRDVVLVVMLVVLALGLGLLVGLLLLLVGEVWGWLVGIRGVRDLVMAWTPWKVPARTR